jgi:phosphoglycolate phosphatase-like HAD superfamily hydrolase
MAVMSSVDHLVEVVRATDPMHIVFDLDGTLTRLDLPWEEWIAQILRAIADPASRERLERSLLEPGAAWGIVLNECVATGRLSRDFIVRVSQDFERQRLTHVPNDALLQRFADLGAGRRAFSIWTSNTHRTVARVLEDARITEHFGLVVACEDVRFGKPDGEGWHRLLSVAPPSRCLIVGDSDNDALAAQSVGVAFVRVEC